MKIFKRLKLVVKTAALIGLSTSLTSCQKSEVSNNPIDDANSITSQLSLGANIKQTTKGELNGMDFKWCSGDQLQVYYGLSASTSLRDTTFDIVEKDADYTNNETFTGSVEDWDAAFNFYVVYPVKTVDAVSSEVTSSVTTYDASTGALKLTLPCNQVQKYDAENNIDPEGTDRYDYKMGTIKNEVPTDHLGNISLMNLMTIVDVNIMKPAENMIIEKVVIRSDNEIFPTEYNYNVEDFSASYANKKSEFSLYLKDADNASYESPSDSTSVKARFLMFPFSVTASDEFYIDVYTEDKLYTLNKTGLEMAFLAGKDNSTNMSLDSSTEWRPTANSYIVSPGSSLTIPVNVRGNGGDVADTELSTSINPSSVGLFWETSLGLISLGELSSDKKVEITAGSVSGNAVIVAYSGENQSGDVLWSWHIWVTDYNPDTESNGTTHTITNSAGASYIFMDRNLGATTTTQGEKTTLGMMYQWGRKDPFPGSDNVLSGSEPTIYDASGIGSTNMLTRKAVTASSNLSNTILNPFTFYYGSYVNNYDWYSVDDTHNNALWGGSDKQSPTEKTIFDPCPAGWRVPVFKESVSPWSMFTESAFTQYGSKLGRVYNNEAYYPVAGTRDRSGGSFSSVGARGYYWSGTPESSNAYNLSFQFARSQPDTDRELSRAFGFSVRCVKE